MQRYSIKPKIDDFETVHLISFTNAQTLFLFQNTGTHRHVDIYGLVYNENAKMFFVVWNSFCFSVSKFQNLAGTSIVMTDPVTLEREIYGTSMTMLSVGYEIGNSGNAICVAIPDEMFQSMVDYVRLLNRLETWQHGNN